MLPVFALICCKSESYWRFCFVFFKCVLPETTHRRLNREAANSELVCSPSQEKTKRLVWKRKTEHCERPYMLLKPNRMQQKWIGHIQPLEWWSTQNSQNSRPQLDTEALFTSQHPLNHSWNSLFLLLGYYPVIPPSDVFWNSSRLFFIVSKFFSKAPIVQQMCTSLKLCRKKCLVIYF